MPSPYVSSGLVVGAATGATAGALAGGAAGRETWEAGKMQWKYRTFDFLNYVMSSGTEVVYWPSLCSTPFAQ